MLSEQYNLNDPEERTSFHNETAKRLAQIEEVLERNNYIEAVSNLYHIDKAGLTDLVHKYGIAGVPRSEIVEREERRAEHESRAADPAKNKPMKLLLTWMVNERDYFRNWMESLMKPALKMVFTGWLLISCIPSIGRMAG